MWLSLVQKYRPYFQSIQSNNKWFDILLLDLDGTLVFTASGGVDQGLSIPASRLHHTNLATLFHDAQSKDDDAISIVDFAPYAPFGGVWSAFLMTPVLDTLGKRVGYVAARIGSDFLNVIIQEYTGLGVTGRAIA